MAYDVTLSDFQRANELEGLPSEGYGLVATVNDTDWPQVIGRFTYHLPGWAARPTFVGVEIRPSGEGLLPLTATSVREFPLAGWEKAARSRVEARLEGPIHLSYAVAKRLGVVDDTTAAPGDTITVGGPKSNVRFSSGLATITASASATVTSTSTLTDAAQAVLVPSIPSGEEFGTPTITHSVSRPPTADDYARLGPEGVVDALNPGLKNGTTPGEKRSYRALVRMATVAAAYRQAMLDGLRDPTPHAAREMGVSVPTARSLLHRARQAGLLPSGQRVELGQAVEQNEALPIRVVKGPRPTEAN